MLVRSPREEAPTLRSAVSAGGRAALRGYGGVLAKVAGLIWSARRASARAVNSAMTATY